MDNSTSILLTGSTAPIAIPLILGYSLNWALYGALTIQIYLYHVSFPHDRWPSKTALYLLWAIETTQTILITHDAFNAYVRSFGIIAESDEIQNEWLAGPVFSAIVSGAVQLYYGYRLGILSGSFGIQAVVSLIALVQCVSGIVCGVQALRIDKVNELATRELVSTSVWLVSCVLCDVIIATGMGYYLLLQGPFYRKPKYLFIALVRSVMESGILTVYSSTTCLHRHFRIFQVPPQFIPRLRHIRPHQNILKFTPRDVQLPDTHSRGS
ncbi:hypothetical protein PHLGIDRAFT_405155 [Phlebiopsis gigantea 11061_1 CR5-6]|uniref:Uncharacterized protein n=1 Tax=Phlebiopsis gigantea (strain 11061_1 CR5-6) TaxID=745531 RepID=A0A0C3S904_PHLG1|nr:hypothetical protein PHLGIDRAFT_405155 [Phlebiopsis gigantea 11061_1 CR5-6]